MELLTALVLVLQATGKEAPEMVLPNQEGKEVKLSSFEGKKNVLLAFYPKDFTGG